MGMFGYAACCFALLTICTADIFPERKGGSITPFLDYAVRLVGGPEQTQGRFELAINSEWGSVCDVGFSDIDAQVACTSLGFDRGQGTFLGNTFGPGTGAIYFSNVECVGTEEVIDDCPHSPLAVVGNCTHDNDVSISCVGTSYDVRLVGGSNEYEGRVEVFYRGEWGTICDNRFGINDARVVCNTLGHGFHGYSLGTEFGPGSGKIWLDQVECVGDESNVGSCAHSPWGVHNCTSAEDISVTCTAVDAAVRLVGGTNANEGRIEAYVDGEWGTVCGNGFGATEAAVACFSLGYDQGQGTFLGNQFGPGSGLIFFENVNCTGSEYTLNECQHSFGATSCTHNDDVSISCIGSGYPLRLVDGVFPSDGRLQIFYRGEWGNVCNEFFTDVDAQVACSALGYAQGLGRYTYVLPGTGRNWLDGLECLGWESNIGQCAHVGWGMSDCYELNHVSISCSASTGTMYTARLIGSDGLQAQSSGRLEYSVGGQWGTVCDPEFTYLNAQVACYSLGFNQFEGTYIGQAHGSGTGNLHLDNVICTGSEVMIDDCQHSVWGVTACDHSTDVSIQCVGPWPANPVRLVDTISNSSNPTEGRLEIQYYGKWGTVCDNFYNFTDTSVRVACASLGFGYVGSYIANLHGPGTGKVWLSSVNCKGDELSIGNCVHLPWGVNDCSFHEEDVSIRCV